MSKSGYRQRRLLKLWKADTCCHWCRRLTVLVFRPGPVNGVEYPRLDMLAFEATIDHLFSRNVGRRQVLDDTEVTVLACLQCNQRRGAEETAAIPREELRRRANNGHGNNQEKRR